SDAGVKKFIHVSTVGAIGAAKLSEKEARCSEKTVYNLEGTKIPYLLTKHHAEIELLKLAEKSKTELIIVNPSIIIASKDSGLTGREYIKRLFSRFFLPEIPNLINLVDIRDVAVGTIAALRKGKRNERYILGGENITIRNLILMISAILGKAPHLISIPRPLMEVSVRMFFGILNLQNKGKSKISSGLINLLDYNWVYTSRKAHEELDYRTRSLQSSLREILQGSLKGTPSNPE
ncbi:MAG: SDR family oxidoreductase, partial [candidate division Zixibacteria bacterium]|nr:SDR family oxidoreductase [candidate division Zixibacteria bacterium]